MAYQDMQRVGAGLSRQRAPRSGTSHLYLGITYESCPICPLDSRKTFCNHTEKYWQWECSVFGGYYAKCVRNSIL